jgi:hypothetical protein
MAHSLHEFMFKTPLRYSTLRPIVQLQHLNHGITHEPAKGPSRSNNKHKSSHSLNRATSATPVQPSSNDSLHSGLYGHTDRETELALKMKGSELLRYATPAQFALAGTAIGAGISCWHAVQNPSQFRYAAQGSSGEATNAFEISWKGTWPLHHVQPTRQLDVVEFQKGVRMRHTRTRYIHPSLFQRVVSWVLRERKSLRPLKEVLHRTHEHATLHDIICRERAKGGFAMTHQTQNRLGNQRFIETFFDATGQLERIVHSVNHPHGTREHAFVPVASLYEALASNSPERPAWRYKGLKATYVFQPNAQGEVDFYDVLPHQGEMAQGPFQATAPSETSGSPPTRYRVRFSQEQAEATRSFEDHASLSVLNPDEKTWSAPVPWKDLSSHHTEELKHLLALQLFIPSVDHPEAFLDDGFHTLPLPLQQANQWLLTPLHQLPEGLIRHFPLHEWVAKPAALMGALTAGMLGIHELLFSEQSPFLQWLQRHVDYATPTASQPERIHNRGENASFGSSLEHSLTNTLTGNFMPMAPAEPMAVIKNTGIEQADEDLTVALQMLSTLGVLEAQRQHPVNKSADPPQRHHQSVPPPRINLSQNQK